MCLEVMGDVTYTLTWFKSKIKKKIKNYWHSFGNGSQKRRRNVVAISMLLTWKLAF